MLYVVGSSCLPSVCWPVLLLVTGFHGTDDKEKDPSFELKSSIIFDTDYVTENFCEDWVSHLSRDAEKTVSLVASSFAFSFQGTLNWVKQELLS